MYIDTLIKCRTETLEKLENILKNEDVLKNITRSEKRALFSAKLAIKKSIPQKPIYHTIKHQDLGIGKQKYPVNSIIVSCSECHEPINIGDIICKFCEQRFDWAAFAVEEFHLNLDKFIDSEENLALDNSLIIRIPFLYLARWITKHNKLDFQDNIIWTENEQISYIETLIEPYNKHRDISFYLTNSGEEVQKCTPISYENLQRIISISKFINNEIPVNGFYIRDLDIEDINFDIIANFIINKTKK